MTPSSVASSAAVVLVNQSRASRGKDYIAAVSPAPDAQGWTISAKE